MLAKNTKEFRGLVGHGSRGTAWNLGKLPRPMLKVGRWSISRPPWTVYIDFQKRTQTYMSG